MVVSPPSDRTGLSALTGLITFSMMLRSICLVVTRDCVEWIHNGVDPNRFAVAVLDGDWDLPSGLTHGRICFLRT